jgi:hypothetical protein
MTWGVDTIRRFSFHISVRTDGATSPVNIAGSYLRRCSLRKPACCCTRGFVGAMNSTLCFFLSRVSAMTIRATMVFPMPVGRTTRVDSDAAPWAMFT